MRSVKHALVGTLGTALAVTGLSALATPVAQANAGGTGLVISEVYGGGGNTGAPYSNDFIELYNPTDKAIPVDGWSVQGRSATSTAAPGGNVTPLTGSVPAHGHYLVQEAAGTTVTDKPLPKPNATGTMGIAGGGWQIWLADTTDPITPPTGNVPAGTAHIVDFVGGATNAASFETARVTSAPSNTLSITRNATGADTDNNAADFSTAAPTPHNAPTVVTPVSASPRADIYTNVGATFPNITLQATGGTPPYSWTATGLPAGVSLASDGKLSGTPTAEGTYAVTATVTDSATPATTDDVAFTINVAPALELRPISEVQGTGDRSTFAPAEGTGLGQTVTIEGVVTGMYKDPSFANSGFDGMYVQQEGTGGTTDATPGASDAVFVYGNASMPAGVALGDSVQVTGRVSEFAGITEITPADGQVVELDTPLDPVTPLAIAYPTTEAGREAQEGMLLSPTDDFTVTNVFQTNQYGEIGLATGHKPLMQPTEVADDDDAAAVQAVIDDNRARGVVLDDGTGVNYLANQTTKAQPLPWLSRTNPPRVGAAASLTDSGVILDYRNNTWKFQPRLPVYDEGKDVATFEDTRASNAAPQDVGGDVKIATFNVLNYFDTTGEAYVAAGPQQDPPVDTHCTYYTDRQGNRIANNQCGVRGPGIPDPNDGRGPRGAATAVSLARQEDKLTNAIIAMDADVIGLEEMENSIKLPGETNRDGAVAHLVQLLNDKAGAGTWKYVRSPGEATTAGAIAEQDTIRPAFIYKPAAVTPVGQSDILFGTDEFANAREPLAQAFKKTGAPDSDAFAVIVNHFKSKGDNASPAPPATGDNANDPQVGAFNGDRTRQARRLVQFANDFAEERGIEAVFLAGDFNAYSMEDPIWELEQGGFALIDSDDPDDESYSHSGLSGSLDHVLGNDAAVAMVTGADVWEINANEAISFEYSRYNYNVTDFWQPELPFGTSDHNPEVVGIDAPDDTAPSYKEIQVLGTNDFHGRLLPDGGNAAGAAPFATAVEEQRAENPNTVFVAAGDLVGASTFESFIQDDNPTIDALNAMGLEVSAAGNHEFDRGYEDLVGRIQDRAAWKYLAANVEEPAGRDDLAESWTKTVDGVQIGFVGAVTEDLPSLVNPAGIEGITVTDVVEATNDAAAQLKAGGADLVILLVHEGSPSTDCTAGDDAATTWGNIVQNTSADVDAIISGHTHLAYNCRYTVDQWASDGRAVTKRPVVSAGQYGTNLNKLVFKYDDQGDLAAVGQEVLATAGVGFAPDPEVKAIVEDAVAVAQVEGSKVLGTMDGPFNRASYLPSGNATENRGGESTLGNQVAEVQRWATQQAGIDTDIAFMNPGGLRADMRGTPNGSLRDLTFRQAADVQPFANTLVNLKLTGAQIETVLEEQWQRTPQGGVPSRPFLRLGVSKGFTYTYVETPETVTAPNAAPVETFRGEVTGMWLDGEPIDPDATYSITVNSFLGSGGDNFRELAKGADKVDSGQVDLQAMVDYMKAQDGPLAVDYSQRAVEVEFPASAPEEYAVGDTVEFDVASWAMSGQGDAKDSELQVKLGDQVVATVPVDNTLLDKPYDAAGKAHVSFAVPASVRSGAVELKLVGATTGTEVVVPITVDSTTEIQILGTNDFHGRLLADGANAAGAAVLSGAVKQLRAENPNTVFAAAGDLIGASTFESFIQKDEPTIDALNEAGLEVSAAGNHEFDQGYEDLVGRVQDRASWEYIAANVEEPTGRDDLAETWTKTFGDVEVGFVGAVTEELPTLVSPAGIEGVTVTDIVDATNDAAAQLKTDGADIVVLLVHEGSPSTDCASANFTDEGTVWGNITQNVSADVDAIISGHTHLAYNCSFPVDQWVTEGRAVTERPVVSAGQYGTNLNKLVLTYDSGADEVTAKAQSIVSLTSGGFPADPAVTSIVDEAKAQADVLGAVKLGEIEAPFNRAKLSTGAENRGGESTLGNLVAEVQRWATEKPESGSAQIAFMNPGGLRADMAGTVNGDVREVSYKQAAVVQPFANTLVNMDLTGAQIETVLEQQWQRDAAGKVPSRPFLRLGVSEGFTYTYVETPVTLPGQTDGSTVNTFQGEVTGMWLDGEPVDPAATYSVTVNSFLASGGDNFRELARGAGKADTGKVDLQAMVDYLAAHAADTPLPVDYSQRAVAVSDVADAYTAGSHVTFKVSSWTMSTADDRKDTAVQVRLDDTVLGSAPLDNTIGSAVYDQYGKATVDVTLPAGTPAGPAELTLVGATTGTQVTVPIEVREPRPIENVDAPSITGTPKVGQQLTADAGQWDPADATIAFQWLADGQPIDGATTSTYTPTSAQVGKAISVRVTATAEGYLAASATAGPTAPVVGVFANTAKPVISGTAKVGQTLRASTGTWQPTPTGVSYQWYADDAAIRGETGSSLKLRAELAGRRITVRVTVTLSGYEQATAESVPTAPVSKGNAKP